MKKSSMLRDTEDPKNTFPELVGEKRLKYSVLEVAPSCSGYARPGDSPSRTLWPTVQQVRVTVCSVRESLMIHLRQYINKRVGVKLPQHSLLLHCFAAKILVIAEAYSSCLDETPLLNLLRHERNSFGKIRKVNNEKFQERHN
jgi:hypothetical protein